MYQYCAHEWDLPNAEDRFCRKCGARDPSCRPGILGHDRNGREVRIGSVIRDIVKGYRGIVVAGRCSATDQQFFEYERDTKGGRDPAGKDLIASWNTELVTDEKAERQHEYDFRDWCIHCGNGRSVIESSGIGCEESPTQICRRLTPTKAGMEPCNQLQGHHGPCVVDKTEGEAAGEILESLCRALAQPTLLERFKAFRTRMLPLLKRFPLVRYDFDCDMESGMVLRLYRPECVPYKGDDWWAFRPVGLSEEAFNGLVIDRLHALAVDIGREVLAGRAILRGGK